MCFLQVVRRIVLIGVLLLLPLSSIWAHAPTFSKTSIRFDAVHHQWLLRCSISQQAALSAMKDSVPPLMLFNAEIQQQWQDYFIKYLRRHIHLKTNQGEVQLGRFSASMGSEFEVVFELENAKEDIDYWEVENTCLFEVYSNQTNLISVYNKSNQLFVANLTQRSSEQIIYLQDSFLNKLRIFYNFLYQGCLHVLPLGLDHILFIVALFLLNSGLRSSIVQASMFTLAHSITLIATGLGYFSPASSIIEPIIALSIAVVAIENIFHAQLSRWRLLLVFSFGLIHGLGFASAFLSLNLPPHNMLNCLIAFNIGVEIAQLFIILFLFFVLVRWIKEKTWYKQGFVKPVSILITCIALYWTVERLLLVFKK